MLFEIEKDSVWTKLKNTKKPIVVYGTGNGADKVFDAFSDYGIKPYGVTASSGFVRERYFRGYKVQPLSFFEETAGDFIVAVAFGSSLPEVIGNIKMISEKHKTLVPCVPVKGNEIFNEQYLQKHIDEINKAYSVLADEKSKSVFSSYINFQYSGKLDYLFSCETEENEVFENIIKFNDNETYVDIGAYRGDTIEKFLKNTNRKYKSIIAAEPDKKTFIKLRKFCEKLNNTKLVNMPVTDTDKNVLFSSAAGRQSSIGAGEIREALCLGSLCDDETPTYIKIDAEGEELEILTGGTELLEKCTPKLNIAAYHKNEDIFKIPIIINGISGKYKIYLRHHPYIPAWDTDYYCVID